MNDENLQNNNVNVDIFLDDENLQNSKQNLNVQMNNNNNFNDDLQNNSFENEHNIDVEEIQNRKVVFHTYNLRNHANIQDPNPDDFIAEFSFNDGSIDRLCSSECDECVLDCLFASDCNEPNSFDFAANSKRLHAGKAAMSEEIQASKKKILDF